MRVNYGYSSGQLLTVNQCPKEKEEKSLQTGFRSGSLLVACVVSLYHIVDRRHRPNRRMNLNLAIIQDKVKLLLLSKLYFRVYTKTKKRMTSTADLERGEAKNGSPM